MKKKYYLISIIIFFILFGLSIIFTYSDSRSSDGALTFGFPLSIYSQNLDRICGIEPDTCEPKVHFLSALINSVIIYLISLILTYLYFILNKK